MSQQNEFFKTKYAHLNPNDVVFTPREIAKAMVEYLNPTGSILEPCKGEGAFMEFIPGAEWCEITEGRDFYDYNKKIDWIITNPPYSDFDRFLEHSFDLSENVGLLVPTAKVFKSMGTIRVIQKYGWFPKLWLLPASRCGFPFGFPCGIFHFKRGYFGATDWKIT